MKPESIKIRVKGKPVELELQAPKLGWGIDKTEWCGFHRAIIRLSDRSHLVLEATPSPGVKPPSDFSDSAPQLTAANKFVEVSPNTWEAPVSPLAIDLPIDLPIDLRFHWASPLTPAGAGLWIQLQLVARSGGLKIVQTQSKIWYAKSRNRSKPDWQFFSPFQIEEYYDKFLKLVDLGTYFRNRFTYAESKQIEGGVISGGGTINDAKIGVVHGWLVDSTRERNPTFAIDGVRRGVEGEQQLVAALSISAAETKFTALSSRALGGAGQSAQRGMIATDGSVNLQGVRVDHDRSRDPPTRSKWIVDWVDVPASSSEASPNVLNLPTLWRHLAGHYPQGLAAARSRSRFTVVPTTIQGPADGKVTLRFEVLGDQYGDAEETALKQVSIPTGMRLDVLSGGAEGVDGKPLHLSFIATDAFAYKDDEGKVGSNFEALPALVAAGRKLYPFATSCFSFRRSDTDVNEPNLDWLLGGVRVRAVQLEAARFTFTLEPRGELLERRPLGCNIEVDFKRTSIAPASQDPESGFESLATLLPRPRPISIDVSGGTASTEMLMKVREFADAGQSRTVRVGVRRSADSSGEFELTSDVVVIDPAPLTIARVFDRMEVNPGSIVAEYTDDSESPAGWEFIAGRGEMQIILPPQAVGEEMIKGRLALPGTTTEVPREKLPFQYRLGANAVITADRTDVDTARAPPPWMLRRLLSRRTGVTGLRVQDAAFELVYGLTTEISARGLRIAELDALIGRIPFSDRLVELVKAVRAESRTAQFQISTTNFKSDERQREYARVQAEWLVDLLKRPSWWPVFRDVGDRGHLALREGVKVSLRAGRETAHPFRIDRFAPGTDAETNTSIAQHPDDAPSPKLPAGTVSNARMPLRGGVDWLFQSPAIYKEFREAPVSTEALVEGVAFGPLGGEGNQSASFANGKTIIISKTRQGHLESLVLMRVGRIAQLWNHARHVIVYQRTSRTAPRYEDSGAYPGFDTLDKQSDRFEKFMALRKVREYVEITQPRRPLYDVAEGPPLAGPLGQSTFETTIIPVKASWAKDIKGGQIIPLSGPMTPEEERIFPRPKIFIEGARAQEKGGGLVPNEAKDPSQYVFFTSTRPQDDGDTDTWPAWPDLDGPVWTPKVPENVDYTPSFRGSRHQPSARRAALGQGRFTFDLSPNQEAVNLMHGRQANAVEARLQNVSVARGLPPIVVPKDALANGFGEILSETDAWVSDKLNELRDYARDHAEKVKDVLSVEHRQFVSDARSLLDKLSPPLDRLVGAIADPKIGEELEKHSGTWAKQQGVDLEEYVTNAREEVRRVAADLGGVAANLEGDKADAASVERIARIAIETAVLQAKRRIEQVSFTPSNALAALRRTIDDLERHVLDRLASRAASVIAAAADAKSAYSRVTTAPEQALSTAADAEARWRQSSAQALLALRQMSVEVPSIVSALLGDLFAAAYGMAGSAQAQLEAAVRELVDSVADELDLSLEEVPPFDLGEPDWESLAELGQRLKLQKDWMKDACGVWLTRLLSGFAGAKWDEEIQKALRDIDDVRQYMLDAITAANGDIDEVIGVTQTASKKIAGWADAGTGLIDKIKDSLSTKLKSLTNPKEWEDWKEWKELEGSFEAASEFAKNAKGLKSALYDALEESSVEEIAAALDSATSAFLIGFGEAVKQSEKAIISDLKAKLGSAYDDLLGKGEATALELTRALASGVNTDTLRCTRDALGYYYTRGQQILDVTRTSAILNDLGATSLNALSAVVPFDRIRDRLLPQLENLNFSDLFPDLCGLKLEYLFPELKVLSDTIGEYEWLKVRHGFDKDRLSAWSDVQIDKLFPGDTTLLALSPVSVAIESARLRAHMRVELDDSGQRKQDVRGSLSGDWKVVMGGKAIVTIREADLVFGNDGKFDFAIKSENVVLAQELKFITDALEKLLPQEEGLTIVPVLPAGVSATLALPLPDLGTGAFTLTGITLYCNFALVVSDGFEIRTGFWLSRPDRPFGLAVLFLGGGGWVGVDVTYRRPEKFLTRVSIGIAAGAFVALNFGFARGSAGLLFTAGVDFYRDSERGGGSTAVSLGLIIWGEFSILCIASAYLRITASITYTSGNGMRAAGRVDLSIRITFFYTLKVNRSFEKQFSGGTRLKLAASVSPKDAILAHFLTLDLPQ